MTIKALLGTVLKYSKEVFVIFIGVSISFLVDRCKNDFQDRDNERLLLQNLRFDLQRDSIQLLSQTEFHERNFYRTQKLFDNIDHIELIRDSAYLFALGLSSSSAFSPVNITFEEIKQNGLSKLIRNNVLKRKIFELYCNDYEDLKVMNFKVGERADNISFPYLLQHIPFTTSHNLSAAQFEKLKKMCSEDTFRILLRSTVKDNKYNIGFYNQASQNVSSLLEMLNAELKITK